MKIDAHHHFWHYNTRDYGWISDEMAVLRRDFLPADLKPELDRAGIDRVVSVQARQCVEETEWLLKLAEENDFIAGVVGWLPVASPEFPALLEKFAANPKLRAIRHVVQDEPDDRFILGKAFNRGVDLNAELESCIEVGVPCAAKDKKLWNEIEGIMSSRIVYRDVKAFLEKFNSEYASTAGDEYEIVLCKGIEEFRAFRIDRCADIWDDEEREEFDYYTDPDSPGFADAAGYLDSCMFY